MTDKSSEDTVNRTMAMSDGLHRVVISVTGAEWYATPLAVNNYSYDVLIRLATDPRTADIRDWLAREAREAGMLTPELLNALADGCSEDDRVEIAYTAANANMLAPTLWAKLADGSSQKHRLLAPAHIAGFLTPQMLDDIVDGCPPNARGMVAAVARKAGLLTHDVVAKLLANGCSRLSRMYVELEAKNSGLDMKEAGRE